MSRVKVVINGYGTIGKRAAEAVNQQDDMEIVGVAKTRPTYEALGAQTAGHPLYIASRDRVPAFAAAGLEVAGTVDEMLAAAEVVIDCTPGKLGVNNRAGYEAAGVKAIWQGGEKHDPIGVSFNALSNYDEAYGADFVRVVSCNTTGLARTLFPLHARWGIDNVKAVMVRRSADPKDAKRGPINSIEPVLNVPSHHGPDVQTVMAGLNIQTMAVKVPTTIMHLHCNIVQLTDDSVTIDDILAAWEATPRVMLIDGVVAHGGERFANLPGTAEIMELARDLGKPRGDLNEIAVWRDGAHLVDGTLYYYQAIHQESDVVPEIIDCIRAMCKLERDNLKSIAKTDAALGLG